MATPKLQDTLEVFNSKLDAFQEKLKEKIDIQSILNGFSKNQEEKNIAFLNDIETKIQTLNSVKLELKTDNIDSKKTEIESVLDQKLKELDILTTKNKANHEQISKDYIRIFRKEAPKGDKYFRFFVCCVGILSVIVLILSLYIYNVSISNNKLSNENKVAKTKLFYTEKYLEEKKLKDKYFNWLQDQP